MTKKRAFELGPGVWLVCSFGAVLLSTPSWYHYVDIGWINTAFLWTLKGFAIFALGYAIYMTFRDARGEAVNRDDAEK